jgi:hypothetical protein
VVHHLSGYVNSENSRVWSAFNQHDVKAALHDNKVGWQDSATVHKVHVSRALLHYVIREQLISRNI